jgi:NAD(P)-dependent dehydrogenase (short-subunit alcohol dehydrogenase family)
MMMQSIAQEVAPRIRVNSIAREPFGRRSTSPWDTPKRCETPGMVPYKRIGEPRTSRSAIWLASDYADYISITLYVDGGMTLYPGCENG